MGEIGGAMEGAEVVYETLNYPRPVEDDSVQQYSVFRNQVTSETLQNSGAPAIDYFSLDPSFDAAPSGSEEPLEETPSSNFISRGNSAEDIRPELGWFRSGSRFRSPMVQLHQEILDFCDFISPTGEEEAARDDAVKRVFEVVKYIWPHCNVEVFGSFNTGLYLPTSDVDVVILNSRVRTPQMGLSALSRALSQKGIAIKIQVIGKARVPIIKFVEKQSGIPFDISFDMQGGPEAATFIKEAVLKMPPLRPLCLILKVFLQQRELNEVFSGGIGSYALISMLIAHLQIHWRGQSLLSQKLQEHNLGTLLVSFFDFYGRKLNNSHVGVSCRVSGNFFVKSTRGFVNGDRPHLLSIEDPQESTNDVGKNSFNYFKVKSAFSTAYSLLTNAQTMSLDSQKSILGTIIRPDPVLLQRKGGSSGDLTFDRLLPGASQPGHLTFEGAGDIFCNWQLMEEEPLPRETVVSGAKSSPSRKRKKSKSSPWSNSNGKAKSEDITRRDKSKKRERKMKKHLWR